MLVIGQKTGDDFVLVVDGKVIATVHTLRRNGSQHFLGVDAGSEVKVFRRKLWDRIKNDPEFNIKE